MNVAINTFFSDVYQSVPTIEQQKKITKYTVAGKELSISTDFYGGCHYDLDEITHNLEMKNDDVHSPVQFSHRPANKEGGLQSADSFDNL